MIFVKENDQEYDVKTKMTNTCMWWDMYVRRIDQSIKLLYTHTSFASIKLSFAVVIYIDQ